MSQYGGKPYYEWTLLAQRWSKVYEQNRGQTNGLKNGEDRPGESQPALEDRIPAPGE